MKKKDIPNQRITMHVKAMQPQQRGN